jgi:predicted patatin/cPLA2 family phospholipase
MRYGAITILALTFLACVNAGSDGKCRAIVLSGGGDKGAYQASVLTTLIDLLPEIETQYDVIDGISVGSLNGGTFSTFKQGEEKEFKEFVMDVWRSVNFETVFKFWPGGFLEGIFNQSGIVDNTPLMNLVYSKIGDRKQQRAFIAGTADVNTGVYKYFQYENIGEPISQHMFDSIFASSAMPGVFPPIFRGKDVLLDGGIVWKNDAVNAIQWCRDKGYADEDIIVDWILCAIDEKLTKDEVTHSKTIGIALRAKNLHDFFGARNDVDRTLTMYPDVNFRYIIGPSETLSVNFLIPLDFSRAHLDKSIAIGKKDAKAAVENGPQVYKQALLKRWSLFGEEEIPSFEELLSQASLQTY